VVEDDIAIRRLVAQALSGGGFRVDEAENGATAWAALCAGTYDLMITDNQMPRLTGVELLDKLHAAGRTLPVIMATGIVPEHLFDRSPWLKPTATLLKPYTLEEMWRTVKEVLAEANRARDPAENTLHDAKVLSQLPETGAGRRRPNFTTAQSSNRPRILAREKRVRLLIIDDSPAMRKFLSRLGALVPRVEVVGVAETGSEGLDLLRKLRPQVVTLDMQMPEMGGIELLGAIKREGMSCILIVLSGAVDETYRKACLAVGADYVFNKAGDFPKLLAILGGG
jgi:CheY-like chemotaxis protein